MAFGSEAMTHRDDLAAVIVDCGGLGYPNDGEEARYADAVIEFYHSNPKNLVALILEVGGPVADVFNGGVVGVDWSDDIEAAAVAVLWVMMQP
jgi:hypothetical protein